MTEPLLNKLLLKKEVKPTAMLTLRIDPALIIKLDEISERVNKSRSQVIKLILEQGVSDLNKTFIEIDNKEERKKYEQFMQKATM